MLTYFNSLARLGSTAPEAAELSQKNHHHHQNKPLILLYLILTLILPKTLKILQIETKRPITLKRNFKNVTETEVNQATATWGFDFP